MMKYNYAIPYIRLGVTMVPTEPAVLPQWASSTVRGAFGNRILEAFCTQSEYRCSECRSICSAGILYGTASPDRSDEAINPYIINCEKDAFDGQKLFYEVTLFSEGVKTVDDVLAVINSGLALGSDRAFFELTAIKDMVNGKSIFDGENFYRPEIHYISFEKQQAKKILIEFSTPYKTKMNSDEFGFEQLIRAALRRISSTLRLSGTEPDFDYHEIIKKASEIKTVYRDTENEKIRRYSNRTSSAMEFMGFTGMIVCEGELDEFMPFLSAIEILHAGKMCVMGLGKIKTYILE
ncbi:MAG: CRISPR system precrRNA processing endoribonuclease RAMP protein Cas6 [Ruminococcus sp.]|nr:CRISPR system precrRNA processing endoribonuclease RAMP protein Cas6 [Ruminococcus sp.]